MVYSFLQKTKYVSKEDPSQELAEENALPFGKFYIIKGVDKPRDMGDAPLCNTDNVT